VKITDTLVEDLGHEGLKFIWKRDGVWNEMEMNEIKSHVKKSLRGCKKTEKKKGLGTALRRKLKQERERLILWRTVRRKVKREKQRHSPKL
jgi:hypothetical protein